MTGTSPNSKFTPSLTASLKPAGRDGQTAGGSFRPRPFSSEGEPGGARLPLATERAANSSPHGHSCGDMYQDPDIETEHDNAPWWLGVFFAALALLAIYWILKAAFYFGVRMIGMVGV